jgi:hypothetical protein
METISIDLPACGELIRLNANQWHTLEAWLAKENIPHHRKDPENAAEATPKQTIITYVIDDQEEKVEHYLRELSSAKK